MATPKTDFPPIRACLFDMDGLLINTEDIYTHCHNILLAKYGAGPMTWDIKSQLQGRPAHLAITLLLTHFSLLPQVSIPDYTTQLHIIQEIEFLKAAPLPGVSDLLSQLSVAKTITGQKVHLALATSSSTPHYNLKTSHLPTLFSHFPASQKVLGDDPRIPPGRGKPHPDIYHLALRTINASIDARNSGVSVEQREELIKPEECLVFEDGIPGVVSGRRAGMRVVWCPHEGLAGLWKGREDEVLAGWGEGRNVSEGDVGELGDGWGEKRVTLEGFDWARYGVIVDQ
ncbi:hypothetical protein VTL71DRAFT_12524 [Oculimacula yallundae]|uniref:HAD-like protein n=1 Tax=Oculimacula yallundae TaxID=86028 RepID=A0ABR4CMT0_9HELO